MSFLKKAQGDITGVVDENGEIILTYTYDAWGNVSFTQTNMADAYLAATLSNVNPFTYRGYCYDFDIGMYYLQSRYYDPQICRFINADSTDYLGATGTLLSYNLFAYCENDAVDFVDFSGTYAYFAISKKSKVDKIKNKARTIFESSANSNLFKISYTTVRDIYLPTRKPYTYKLPSHIYKGTTLSSKDRRVLLYYLNNPGSEFRVKGELYYRTPTEWKLYIQSKHMTTFTKIRNKILKIEGIDEDEYAIYMECLSYASAGTAFEVPVFIYSVIDTVMDLISGYLDKTDKIILKCIKKATDKQYVIIAWAAYYQQYCKIGRGMGWRTNSTKRLK